MIIYSFLILSDISIITLIPISIILLLNVIIFRIAKRENIEEYKNCLDNIGNVIELKKDN